MSALYAWLRRHPRCTDAVIAFPLALLGVAHTLPLGQPLLAFFALLLAAPIMERRTHPVGAFAFAATLGAFQILANIQPVVSDVSIVILLYALAAYSTRRNSVVGLAVSLLGSAAEVARLGAPRPAISTPDWLAILLVIFAGPTLIAWVLGDSARYRRAYYASLEERAERLERERDANVKIAAAAERARIARELHDVVAHNVSVMVVQADGAAYALGTDPGRAREALAAISATGRQALAEMRALLGVLRRANDTEPGDQASATLAPMPGLAQLNDLLDQTRAAGLPVTCTVEGHPVPLAAGTALTAYRIIQESLTNTRKHAGLAARADVLLRYTSGAIELTVTDSGIGAAAPCDGAGHGLTGMTERAELYGGVVRAGPKPGGGFRVEARLPVGAAAVGGYVVAGSGMPDEGEPVADATASRIAGVA